MRLALSTKKTAWMAAVAGIVAAVVVSIVIAYLTSPGMPPLAAPSAGSRQRVRRSCGGLGIRFSGFQLAMVRAHSTACALSVIPGNRRRSSMAAENSPRCSKTARIAAAFASVTTNIVGAWRADRSPASPAARDAGQQFDLTARVS